MLRNGPTYHSPPGGFAAAFISRARREYATRGRSPFSFTYVVTDGPIEDDRPEREALDLRRGNRLADADDLDRDLVLALASVRISIDRTYLPHRLTGVHVQVLSLTLAVIGPPHDRFDLTHHERALREVRVEAHRNCRLDCVSGSSRSLMLASVCIRLMMVSTTVWSQRRWCRCLLIRRRGRER